jgi:hypothetical protein
MQNSTGDYIQFPQPSNFSENFLHQSPGNNSAPQDQTVIVANQGGI